VIAPVSFPVTPREGLMKIVDPSYHLVELAALHFAVTTVFNMTLVNLVT
jgi:hypothetical protein